MARNVRRRRKQRFYWAEIGFLILGLIGLRPSIVMEVFSMGKVLESRTPWNTNALYDTTQRWTIPSAPQSHAFSYPTVLPSSSGYASDRATQYQANYPSLSNTWDSTLASRAYTPTHSAAQPWNSQSSATPSQVAWPDSQLHNYVHTGGQTGVTPPTSTSPYSTSPYYGAPMTAVAPHVASPYYGSAYAASQYSVPPPSNGLRYQPPITTNPTYNNAGYTGTGVYAAPPYTGRY